MTRHIKAMQRVRIRDIRNAEFIEATLHAVHKHGLGAVTMSEIAQETGATAASISYYFGSKERLMEATMRHLLGLLRGAVVRNLATAKDPRDRLYAILDANFDDTLFTAEKCSVWVQFWSAAPYAPALARLQKLNRARVASHLRRDLRPLVATDQAFTIRQNLQSYMDGVWLNAAQTETEVNALQARREARAVLDLLLASDHSPRG